MTVLTAPNLDDRRFQDLVDDAKRLVQANCPEWTDHNVSDPGVTLIETFALMLDQLFYRLNRVPDRLYVKFLELIGVRVHPPGAARTEVTFWLTAPQREVVRVPVRTEIATRRTETAEPVVFVSVQPSEAVPTSLAHVATGTADGAFIDRDADLIARNEFRAFSERPAPGDCLYLALDRPAPWCAVNVRLDCEVSGVGVNPEDAPLAWEALVAGDRWVACDVERDDSKGMNRPGDVVIHVPSSHVAAVLGGRSGGWLRCRLLEPEEHQPTYQEAPVIHNVEVFTVGVDCPAINAAYVEHEELGVSDGTPGQRFALANRNLVPTNDPLVVEVAEAPQDHGGGWTRWTEVDNFAASGPDDRHVMIDLARGEVEFGPAVRLRDGGLRQYGKVPPLGARIRLQWYWHGGGSRGNVGPNALTVLKSAVPGIRTASNRRAARGGVDAETIDEAKVRGPIELRTLDRAVTAEDYELLVRRGAPEVARVRCLRPEENQGRTGVVRVLLVPHVSRGDEWGAVPIEEFRLAPDIRERVQAELDRRRLVGTMLEVDEPEYRWVTVVARVQAKPGYSAQTLERALHRAVHEFLHPVFGGPEGRGWPFGRPLHLGEIHATLQRVEGVEFVEDARLFAVDPETRRPTVEIPRLVLEPHQLIHSFRHDVAVEEA